MRRTFTGTLAAALALALLVPGGARADKTTEANKKIAKRYVEEIANQGKLDVADEIISASYVYHGRGPEGTGPQVVKDFYEMFHAAFSNLNLSIEDMIAEGDRVVIRLTGRGVNDGPFMGMDATNKKVEAASILIVRIANGKIAEEWEVFDEAGMMMQLGILPEE